MTGEENENNVVIEQGLEAGTMIYLSTPENIEKFKLTGQDLIAVNQERAKAKREEEKRIQEENAKASTQGFPGREGMSPEMMQRFQQMRGGAPQGGAMGAGGQSSPRDTAAIRRMIQSNPEMRQRMQDGGGMRRDSTMRRRNPGGQQGQAQTPPPGTPEMNQN